MRTPITTLRPGAPFVLAVILIITGSSALAADAKAGKAVYMKACRSCHGTAGAPNAATAKMLKVEMRDLKVAVSSLSDPDIRKIIVDGKGKMVATKGVAGADLDNVIAYMHTLK